MRCSGWRKTRQALKSPPSITRRSSALFSIQANDIWAAGCRNPSTSRSASLAGRLDRRRLAQAELVLDLRDAGAGRQVEERQPLPLDGVLRQRHQRVLVDRGEGAGGQRLVDAEHVDEVLAVKPQVHQQRQAPRPAPATGQQPAGGAAATGWYRQAGASATVLISVTPLTGFTVSRVFFATAIASSCGQMP